MGTLVRLRAITGLFVLISMASLGIGRATAENPKMSTDDVALAYEAWLADSTAEIEAVNVPFVMTHNATFTQHELTAIANYIDVNNDDVADINYVYKFPGAKNVIITAGFALGLGQDNGWVFTGGQHMEQGLVWTMLPVCAEVEFIDGTVRSIDIEAGSLVAVGMIVSDTSPTAGSNTTANWCEITCDPGFWGCCNLEPLSCKCVRNTVRNPTCQSGGEGARTCSAGTRPSNSNRDDFTDQAPHHHQNEQ